MKRSVIDVPDLTPEELDRLMDTAEDIIAHPDDYADACRRKKLATLFFEPSTRTRLSFEAAMYELGGYRQNRILLRGYHRHAPSQGRRGAGGGPQRLCTGDQRR